MNVLAGAVRALLLGAIIVFAGANGLYWLVLQRSAPSEELQHDCTTAAFVATRVLLFSLPLIALVQFREFHEPGAPMVAEAGQLLGTSWGYVWIVQVCAALFAASARWWPARSRWILLSICALLLVISPSFASHAASSEWPRPLALSTDILHVTAGSLWIGGLVVLTWLITRMQLRAGEAIPDALRLVLRFSPLALTAASVIVVSGVIGALQHIRSLQDLVASGYGRLLTIKLLLFGGVVLAGAHNWRKATPRLQQTGDARDMLRSMRMEVVIASLLVIVTAFLVITSPPGE